MIDERFSEKGKADAIAKMKAELNKLNNENRDHLKNLITEFCKEMKLKFQDDGKDHAAEVANALKVIDMIGIPEITPDIVSSLVKPFQNAYDSLKIIYDLFKVKSENLPLAAILKFWICWRRIWGLKMNSKNILIAWKIWKAN